MMLSAMIALAMAASQPPSPAQLRARSTEELSRHYARAPFRFAGATTDQDSVNAAKAARCGDDAKCAADFQAGFDRLSADWHRKDRRAAVERHARAATKSLTDWQFAADTYEADFPLVTDPARIEARYQADRASARRHCEKVLAPMGEPVASSAVTLESCIEREVAARRRLER